MGTRALPSVRASDIASEFPSSRLRPFPRAIHDIQRQSRLEGTCEWIWANPGFMQLSTRSSQQASDRILCDYGPPGCRKSVLASSIEEGFRKKQFTTLFYSFSGMDADRQSINGLIRNFLWQLLQDSSDEGRLDIMLNLIRNGSAWNWRAMGYL